MRPIDLSRFVSREKRTPEQYIWMRAQAPFRTSCRCHQCVLAYAPTLSLLDTALIAHGKLMFDKDIQLASLDHALWFHRPFGLTSGCSIARTAPPAMARGFCRGSFYTRDGTLWRRSARKA